MVTKLLLSLRLRPPNYSSHKTLATDSLVPILKGSLSRTYERKSAALKPTVRSIKIPPESSTYASCETMPWSTGSAGPFSPQMRCTSLRDVRQHTLSHKAVIHLNISA
jgi:hypothetical protein